MNKCIIKTRVFLTPYLIKHNIYYKVKRVNDYYYYTIDVNNINLLSEEIEEVKYLGVRGLLLNIKKHLTFIISVILSLIMLYYLSNMIFEIEVNTSNYLLKEEIINILKENNIEKYRLINKNNNIKEILLNKLKDKVDFIEVSAVGTKFIIDLNEKINEKDVSNAHPSNIVASKDGLIKYISVYRGSKVKEVNEFVRKDEVIISGDIIYNEEVKSRVDALGKVYASVWYTVNTIVPFKHTIYKPRGEVVNTIYLEIFGKRFTLMGKYKTDNYIYEEEVLYDKPYLPFKIIKESKELYTYEEVELNEEEAYLEAIKRSDEVILDRLSSDEEITLKKVLKKNVYSSKIEVEVFYEVYENITKKVLLEGE